MLKDCMMLQIEIFHEIDKKYNNEIMYNKPTHIWQVPIYFNNKFTFITLILLPLSQTLTTMNYDQEQQLPPLVPIKKKRQNQSNFTPQPEEKTKHLQSTQPKTQQRSNPEQFKTPQPIHNNRSPFGQQKQNPKTAKDQIDNKVQNLSQKFKNIQQKTAANKNKVNKKSEQQKKQQNEKSKFLIAEMLNKISVKNISQELYPITNETIETVIHQMDEQIKAYMLQAQKKENILQSNPNNQHLKQEIASLQKSIDHCNTIKELYQQKINFRNKTAILEGKIIELRAENRDLKIKVSRNIQKIENHMHSLPCEKQKELKEKLNKCTEELKKEKQMRTNLQSNIQDIIMNFKRLYEEADTARQIVTKKLKEIEEREKKINEAKLQLLNDVDENSNSIKRSPKLEPNEQKRSPKPINPPHESQSSTQRFRPHSKLDRDPRMDKQKTDKEMQKARTQTNNERKPMNFEESIQKMRGNQSNLARVYNRG